MLQRAGMQLAGIGHATRPRPGIELHGIHPTSSKVWPGRAGRCIIDLAPELIAIDPPALPSIAHRLHDDRVSATIFNENP